MPSRCASLVISVEKSESDRNLVITPLGGESLRAGKGLGESGVKQQLDRLRSDLEKNFKNIIGGDLDDAPNWPNISRAMQNLHFQGRTLAYQLFGTRLHEVQKLFCTALPLWNHPSITPKVIQMISPPGGLFPLEFLPLFDLRPPPEITDLRSLREVAHRFIGFSTIIKRTMTDREPLSADPVLENHPKLPVKFFYHSDLEGARREAEFFRGQSDYIDLEGPWPDRDIAREQFSQNFAEHLWNTTPRFDGSEREPPDQIQHFSCHCDTTSDIAVDHFLRLAHCKGADREVTVEDLQGQFAGFQGASARRAGISYPLVFFNACGSAARDPFRAGSFSDLFLEINNRGIIGTECGIPDKFAASFSEQFYRAILGGQLLGDAIYYAKWQMLERHKNPLGILYTVYADPDMHVRNKIN